MSDKDLDTLCGVLRRMPPEDVVSLTKHSVWWLPDLRGIPPMEAVVSIRHALESLYSFTVRAYGIAWLYCWIADFLVPWLSFELRNSKNPPSGVFVLHDRLASALKQPDGHAIGAKRKRDGAIYACVLATRPGSTSQEHDIICLCCNPSHSTMFVHISHDRVRVFEALYGLLRGNRRGGFYGELRFAFSNGPDTTRRNGVASDEFGLVPWNSDQRARREEPSQSYDYDPFVDYSQPMPISTVSDLDTDSDSEDSAEVCIAKTVAEVHRESVKFLQDAM